MSYCWGLKHPQSIVVLKSRTWRKMNITSKAKILVSCWVSPDLQLLIPKQRGIGFLKVPAGQHHESWMHDISYDINGLDGYLNIHCECNSWESEAIKSILQEIMPVITKRFPFDWELVDSITFERALE